MMHGIFPEKRFFVLENFVADDAFCNDNYLCCTSHSQSHYNHKGHNFISETLHNVTLQCYLKLIHTN